MTLTLPPGPPQGFDIVRENAPMLIGEAVINLHPDPEIGEPWPVYLQKIQALDSGAVVSGAVLIGWQYPIFAEAIVLGIAEVSDPPPQWAALHPRVYGTQILNAIHFAEFKTSEGLYELRLLRVPSASVHAVWLHNTTDQFVPINTGGIFDSEFTILTEAKLVESVKGRIPERLKATENRGA